MKVKDLIAMLHDVDPEASVFVPGYEGGYRFAGGDFSECKYYLDVHSEWYYGPHDLAEFAPSGKYQTVKGICL